MAESEECTKHYRSAVATYKALPLEFRGLSQQKIEEVGRQVENAVIACRSYLDSCRDDPRRAEMHFYFAKFLYLMSARHRNEVIKVLREESKAAGTEFPSEVYRERMNSYYGTIAEHADKATAGMPRTSGLLPDALQILGQARSGSGDHQGARDVYHRFLENYRDHKAAVSVFTALGREYLSLELYDDGIRLLQEARKDPSVLNHPSYPYLAETLWKLNEAKGDFTGMVKVVEEALERYPERMKDASLEQHVRDDYKRYWIFSGFRRPYALFARGDIEPARAAFHEYIETLTELQNRDPATPLPPYGRIYLQRGQVCLEAIENLVGKPAPAEFLLEDLWATPSKVTLKDSRGKAVAVVFRRIGDARSAPFLEGLDDFCSQHRDLQVLTVSYLRSSANVVQQLDELREELASIGYRGAAGLDPDSEGKQLFRAYKASVGSATFIVIDPEGNYAWFQQDPRGIDVNLARNILRRWK